MTDEIFGESSEPELTAAPKLVVPPRCLNFIEVTLIGQLAGLDAVVPQPPFVEDDGSIESGEFAGLPLRTALDLRNLMLLDAEEILRRQIIIARELGPVRMDGGPFNSEYEIACIAEGVVPWPLGDPLHHEKETIR